LATLRAKGTCAQKSNWFEAPLLVMFQYHVSDRRGWRKRKESVRWMITDDIDKTIC
jgi:hypothetical protein